MFVERWYSAYMMPRLREAADPLIEYREPINSRILRKADALSPEKSQRFRDLREKHFVLGMGLMALGRPISELLGGEAHIPSLPLRDIGYGGSERLPAAVLDATALRPLLDVLLISYAEAISEFDDVFGERA
jgi:hypothetical protein